jgi:dihydroorotase
MNILIKSAKIIDPKGSMHQKITDIRIIDGRISEIKENLPEDQSKIIALENLHISAGWFDSSVSLGEPGFEERETMLNGLDVAAKSGFTGIAMQPNTQPVIDMHGMVAFIKSKASGNAVDLYPIGSLTKGSQGKDIAELFDMKQAGAVAFGDYNTYLDNANLLKIALQYVQDFDGLLITYPMDRFLAGQGIVNEGISATGLGLKGNPALAEDIQISRNLQILEYTGGKLHIPCISTRGAAGLIREAKSKGLDVTCSVSVHHLALTDEVLKGFDTRYKVTPPLRTEDDRQALLEAVKDGTIDMITSDHNPIDIENKKIEFDLAKNGTIGLESAFVTLNTLLELDTVIEKLTAGRSRFGAAPAKIQVDTQANLTLFNPEGTRVFSFEDILSKSKNAALAGYSVKGCVYGIINNDKLIIGGR